ncbi:MAG: DUF2169 domain-containing protein [Sandaracinaceae bacterium]|nr:DUF2169 domain-containing protein [Sandaracinaceae bacterium]
MKVVRASPFELGTVLWPLRPGSPLMLLVVKATYELQHGVAARIAKAQDTCSGPRFVDDDPDLSLVYPGDFDPLKPTGECFLVGSCHPPGGRARASEVRFKCGAIDKRIAVFGDRHWEGSLLTRRASDPEPFTSMPLTWERAFGGSGFEPNPFGRGASPIETPEGSRHPLPNLERPGALLDGPGARPDPAVVSPIHPTAAARLRLAGTYDEAWQRDRFPYYPVDLHPDYFLSAPPDQRMRTYWAGTETIGLGHLHPEHAWLECRLPGLRPRAFVERDRAAAGKLDEIHLKLDTIVVDAERLRVICLHRGLFAVRDAAASDIRTLFLLHERVGEQQSLEACEDLFEAQLRVVALEEAGFSPLDPQDDADAQTLMRVRDAAKSLGAKNEAAMTLVQVIATMVDIPAPALDAPPAPDVEGSAPALDAAAVAAGFGKRKKPIPVAIEEDPIVGESVHERALLDYAEGRPWRGDLTRVKLAGERFDDLDAEGALLRGADLTGCSLRGARLAGAMLAGARLAGADLTGARLEGADLSGALLDGALLDGALLDGAVLDRASLDGASLVKASLAKVEARGASFVRANLEGASASELVLVHGTLREARCRGASFADARLRGVDATAADFSECDLSLLRGYGGARFDGASLTRARADRARFGGSSLVEADLSFTTLERASFAGAILRGAVLDGCRLKKAKLKGADLTRAKVRAADLMQAKLGGAILSETDLRGSSLFAAETRDAIVDRARFEGADLTGTKLARFA